MHDLVLGHATGLEGEYGSRNVASECDMIRACRQLTISSQYQIASCKISARARSYQSAMQVVPLVKQLASVGAACYFVSHPFACYAAPADKISGSDDAPSVSELQQGGEDKQPPNFNYTHLW